MGGRVKPRILLLAAIFGTWSSIANAHKIPDSSWKKGFLKDIQAIQETGIRGTVYQGNGSLQRGTYTVQHFIIESPEMIYEAIPIKTMTYYAIEKHDIYLRDPNSNVGKFHIIKKTMKNPQISQP